MADSNLYFAYGSNINLEQMLHRCPAAQVVGPVTLEGYELLFRGSGVATIGAKECSTVHGLLWRVTPQCERTLDRYEGYPYLYGKESVTVKNARGRTFTVMAYVMTERYLIPAIPPEAYYAGIEEGYRQNGLPVERLRDAWIQAVKEVDADTRRINAAAVKSTKRRDDHER